MQIAFVSTYPPTRCGLATFTEALVRSLRTSGTTSRVLRVVDSSSVDEPRPEVLGQWNPDEPGELSKATDLLNRFDVVVLQHEYGIYGPRDGEAVLQLAASLDTPLVTTLHTVLARPGSNQRQILEELVDMSSVTVVATRSAQDRLLDTYSVDPSRIQMIPHGAHTVSEAGRLTAGTPIIVTYGLLAPGKGIEWAIQAMSFMEVPAHYVIVGGTHPKVFERTGDAYRRSLQRIVSRTDLEDQVQFVHRYMSRAELDGWVAAADVILLPYDNDEQVTSGPLTEALAAGKPVVATAFPHAMELLKDGAGLVVPQRDPKAMANALDTILADPATYRSAAIRAAQLGRGLGWGDIGRRYLQLLTEQVEPLTAISVA